MKKFLPLIFAIFLLVAAGTVYAANMRFETDMTGSQEVSPVQTNTRGEARFRFDEDDNTIEFRVRVRDAQAVTQAHLHCAPAGQNGPVVVTLFGNVPGGFDVDGELADFTIHDSNIVTGACSGISDVGDLANAMNNGTIYANIHTVAHPNGEIRGQLGND